ncbi:hypothetical protein Tco_0243421 [Tanacetum coccineum]
MKDEAGSNLNSEENDFMLDTSYGDETMEELAVAVMLMARIQPADGNVETVPSYDAKAVSEVSASSKAHGQVCHVKRKTIIQTSDDDQTDSNNIFDDPYVENNGGTNSTGVESSNSVRRPKSKDIKSKNRVLKNTNDKSSSTYVRKMSSSVSIDSNKCETMNSTICHANTSVLNTKNVTAVNDGSNIVCVSCGKDVFLFSHEKCVARYALSRNSSVKRALFTTPLAAKSKNLGATSVVVKSRLSIAKTPTATNKVIQLILWIVDSGCSKHMTGNLQLLRNFIKKFMGTVCFGNDHFTAITGYGDYV